MADVRDLAWEGCLNVRDLGGHPTEDGGETRYGAVVRADSIRQLTPAGWEALAAHGIRRAVDLRSDGECVSDPPDDGRVEVVRVPILPELDSPEWVEVHAIADDIADDVAGAQRIYLEFLERYRSRFADAVAAVACSSPGGVVLHCVGGKDRTGLVAALLLRLAGVAPEPIAADYALSGPRLEAYMAERVAAAPDERERARRLRASRTPAAIMLGVLEELDGRYGGVAGYLRAAGLADDDLVRARAHLHA